MKKVLIITYYWPPAGGPGVQRVLKFAKYLPQFGWEPIILTVDGGDYPAIDKSLEKSIPKNCKVYKTKTIEPFNIFKLLTGKKKDHKIDTYILTKNQSGIMSKLAKWVRANLFVPDARVGWYPNAVKQGLKIIKSEKIDMIFSSSPPHSLQLIAKKLHKKSGVKWVADFRDPWSNLVYNQNLKRSFITKLLDEKFEKNVFSTASSVVSISNHLVEEFKEISNNNYFIIPNGYDEDDFSNINSQDIRTDDIIEISYAGALSKERLPVALFPALQKLKEQDVKFRVNIYGNVCPEFKSLAKKYKIESFVNYIAYVPHSELVKKLQNADILLLVIDDVPNNIGFLSGKLFDYMGYKKPILAYGPVNGDASKIIDKSSSGELFDYKDIDSTIDFINKINRNKVTRENIFDFNTDIYSRKNLTCDLVKVFDSII
jgi:glycosyltransferase involved in cell wall biosynthesis